MRQAWAFARADLVPTAPHSRLHLRAAVEAEMARRSALPAVEREILTMRDARAIAPMTDSTRRMVADLVAIDARAAALGVML